MIFPSLSIVFCALPSPGHALRTLPATQERAQLHPLPPFSLSRHPSSGFPSPAPHLPTQTRQNALWVCLPLGTLLPANRLEPSVVNGCLNCLKYHHL